MEALVSAVFSSSHTRQWPHGIEEDISHPKETTKCLSFYAAPDSSPRTWPLQDSKVDCSYLCFCFILLQLYFTSLETGLEDIGKMLNNNQAGKKKWISQHSEYKENRLNYWFSLLPCSHLGSHSDNLREKIVQNLVKQKLF